MFAPLVVRPLRTDINLGITRTRLLSLHRNMTDASTVSSNAASCYLLNAFCSRLNTRSTEAEQGCTSKIFFTATDPFGRAMACVAHNCIFPSSV